ncbi:uncharacterized protein EDB93DRAFT_1100973 [Suillus bovinus]|uniref:uncharacterized protein n=1 Tax=Suillus bovinus TaxID=48563 RepID=UPI001B86EFFD|nr:uncharacterized protein EDB93DRAFT_1100973 [Suillus bovinus]KAG2157623.1 hypothetical protein EDB93DRAFT_1100973 [Suillus bovinus]
MSRGVLPHGASRTLLLNSAMHSLPEKEFNTALQETLSSQIPPPAIPEDFSHHSVPVKMSTTHPLNISTILPPELLPAMSSHLIINPEPSPVIFHIPDFYTLHRITDYAQPHPINNEPYLSNTHTRPLLPSLAKLPSPTLQHSTKVRVVSDDFTSNWSSYTQRGTSALPKVGFPSMLDFLDSANVNRKKVVSMTKNLSFLGYVHQVGMDILCCATGPVLPLVFLQPHLTDPYPKRWVKAADTKNIVYLMTLC